jgi:hypothetical protein
MGDDDPTTILMSPAARSMVKSSKALSISPSESPSQVRGSKKNVSPPSAVNGAEFSPKSGSRQVLHNNGASEFILFVCHLESSLSHRLRMLHTLLFIYLDPDFDTDCVSFPLSLFFLGSLLQVVPTPTPKDPDPSCQQAIKVARFHHTGTHRPMRT